MILFPINGIILPKGVQVVTKKTNKKPVKKKAAKKKAPVKRRARAGQPAFKPNKKDRATVTQMCAVGIPHKMICKLVRDGIDDKTLRKHFKKELDTAKAKANASIGGALYKKAMAGDTASLIFWAKTQMGWKETVDLTSSDGSMSPRNFNDFYPEPETKP